MTALDAYIKTTKHRTNLWSKLSETVKESITKAIKLGMYQVFITKMSDKDKMILIRLKYNIHFNNGGYWITWNFKPV